MVFPHGKTSPVPARNTAEKADSHEEETKKKKKKKLHMTSSGAEEQESRGRGHSPSRQGRRCDPITSWSIVRSNYIPLLSSLSHRTIVLSVPPNRTYSPGIHAARDARDAPPRVSVATAAADAAAEEQPLSAPPHVRARSDSDTRAPSDVGESPETPVRDLWIPDLAFVLARVASCAGATRFTISR